MTDKGLRDATLLTHAGNHPERHRGIINPPVYHASTVLFPSVESAHGAVQHRFDKDAVYYGRYGTPTHHAFEEALAELEGTERALALPSGVAAIAAPLLAFLGAGDHLLMADNVYQPARGIADALLKRLGIETTFFDPADPTTVARLKRTNTKLLYLETPGSLTFEMIDVPAFIAEARRAGLKVLLDNTWATPFFYKAARHGVDVVIHSATKYIVGHSDVSMGAIACNDADLRTVKTTSNMLGMGVGPDDVYLALRGLRTLAVRLARHQENALAVARWLQTRPEVLHVLYPALPQDPGHAIWARDFAGASGLFGVVLKPAAMRQIAAMLDHMKLFGIGFSWGGYESLILHVEPEKSRTATRWEPGGPTLRLHIGLEDPADLIADLESGFERLGAAA